MSSKTLLVLAASIYQLETIITAKQLGYRVITVDNIPANPGHKLADKCYNISIIERSAILEIAEREKIDGIIAACTDIGVPTAAYVAEKKGLPGPPWPESQILTDKPAFRKFLSEHNYISPYGFCLTRDVQLDPTIFKENTIWIIKPDRSSGSKGIFILRSIADLYHRLPDTLAFSPTGTVILEEFIDGFQGTCEGVIQNGELILHCIMDRQTANPPYVTTIGHLVPSRLPAYSKNKLLAILKTIFSKLRVLNGPFDCDFVVQDKEVYILEVSPRIGGNSISRLLRKAMGFDIVEYSVKHACEENMIIPNQFSEKPTAVIILGTSQAGSLCYNHKEFMRLKGEGWVDYLAFDVSFGEQVLPFINGRHRVGEALVHADSRDALEARVAELKDRLNVGAI